MRAAPRPSSRFDLGDWRVDDRRGQRVGAIAAVYVAPGSDGPSWFLVRLARHTTRFVLTPPADVLSWRGHVSLPWERALIERAPVLYAPPRLVTPEMERRLRSHYRLAEVSDVRMTIRRSAV